MAESSKVSGSPRYMTDPSTVTGLVAIGGMSYGMNKSRLSLELTRSESTFSKAARIETAPEATEIIAVVSKSVLNCIDWPEESDGKSYLCIST